MGFGLGLVVDGVRLGRLPLLGDGIGLADGVAQGAVLAGRLAELLGELAQEALPAEVAAGLRDLVAQGLGKGEVLE